MRLAERIEKLFTQSAEEKLATYGPEYFDAFAELKQGLNSGAIRAAEPAADAGPTGWRVNAWVKMGILIGFRIGVIENMSADHGRLPFFDKSTFPLKRLSPDSGVRIVPGGSAIRDGSYIGKGVTCMPPMYVNVGAYVDEGTMIDSHALVGSCAQVGERVHLSAASQVGGVLEPVGASPVVIEDDVVVGGNCGIYEGAVVRARAVLADGVILTRGTPVYDLVKETVYRGTAEAPLEIPPAAVVVPGARAVKGGWGAGQGLSLQTPVIVKYRDDKTDLATALESWLR